MIHRDILSFGDQHGDTTAGRHQDQRSDHWLDIQFGHQKTVPNAANRAYQHRRQTSQQKRNLCRAIRRTANQRAADRARNRNDRALRNVDTAGGDDERHAHGQHDQNRRSIEDIDQTAKQLAILELNIEKAGSRERIE